MEPEAECLLVIIGATPEGRKELLGFHVGTRESAQSWREPRVGAMLPCNVIVRRVADGVEVSAIDPVASMTAIDNQELKRVAGQVRDLLGKVVEKI
jgi:hypothetical protein